MVVNITETSKLKSTVELMKLFIIKNSLRTDISSEQTVCGYSVIERARQQI